MTKVGSNAGLIPSIIAVCVVTIALPSNLLDAQADSSTSTDANLVPGQVFRDCPSCPAVVVPAGTFIVGSPKSEAGQLRVVYDREDEAISWTTDDAECLEVEAGPQLVIVEGRQH